MTKKTAALLVGWHPDVVDYSKWPRPTPEKLPAGLEGDRARLEALGYDAELGLLRSSEWAASSLQTLLSEKPRDCVLIGAGVRTIPEYLHFFESLANTFHDSARKAKLCFNSGPFDSVDAVQRRVRAA
jgi:hypothetical protein